MTDDLTPFGLGWVESPPDERDWPVDSLYAVMGAEPPALDGIPASYHVPAPLYPVLDQGSSPMCVAYSAAGEQGWYDLRDQGLSLFDEPAFFRSIGGTANGAVIRDALNRRLSSGYPVTGHPELAPKHRIAAYYSVPTTRADLCAAILSFGPLVIGTPWPGSWFHPVNGVLPPFDYRMGGHAIQAVGWDATGLRLRNSWGADWGQSGEATLPWSQLYHLREAWKAIDVIDPKPSPARWRLLIAPHTRVRVATLNAAGRIAYWTDQTWGATASGAPCLQPVIKQYTRTGQTTVAYVTAGASFRRKWVHVGMGTRAVMVSAAVAAEEDPQP